MNAQVRSSHKWSVNPWHTPAARFTWSTRALTAVVVLSTALTAYGQFSRDRARLNPASDDGGAVFSLVIDAGMDAQTATACGTGFFVSQEGLVLTADHVARGLLALAEAARTRIGRRIYITALVFHAGSHGSAITTIPLTVAKEDAKVDLALLKPLGGARKVMPKVPALEIETQPVEVGQPLVVRGYPFLAPYLQSEASQLTADDWEIVAFAQRLEPIVTFTRLAGWSHSSSTCLRPSLMGPSPKGATIS